MPLYFFHLVKDSEVVVQDVTGHECANDQDAQQFALRGDGLIVLRAPPPGPLKQYQIQVLNEAGQVTAMVPLAKVRTA
jgi:hypothetical protein